MPYSKREGECGAVRSKPGTLKGWVPIWRETSVPNVIVLQVTVFLVGWLCFNKPLSRPKSRLFEHSSPGSRRHQHRPAETKTKGKWKLLPGEDIPDFADLQAPQSHTHKVPSLRHGNYLQHRDLNNTEPPTH